MCILSVFIFSIIDGNTTAGSSYYYVGGSYTLIEIIYSTTNNSQTPIKTHIRCGSLTFSLLQIITVSHQPPHNALTDPHAVAVASSTSPPSVVTVLIETIPPGVP